MSTCVYTYVNIYPYLYAYTYVCVQSQALSTERFWEQAPPEQCVPGSQILAFKYHSSLNEPGLPGEMADSRARAGRVQDELGIFAIK